MFYLSERNVIQALLDAAKRGVAVRVHPRSQQGRVRPRRRTAFPTARWPPSSAAASDGAIKVRWFRTHGEQFHSKLVAMRTADGILVHAGFGQSHAPQPRGLQPRGQHRRERAAECGNRHADQRLVRLAVDQSRPAGARVHRGIRRLRRSRRRAPTGSTASWKPPACRLSDGRLLGWRERPRRGARPSSVMAVAVAASNAATTSLRRSSPATDDPCAVKLASSSRSRCRPSVQSSATCTVGARPPCCVVGLEAPQRAAQVVARRERRGIVEHRGETSRWRAAHRSSRFR